MTMQLNSLKVEALTFSVIKRPRKCAVVISRFLDTVYDGVIHRGVAPLRVCRLLVRPHQEEFCPSSKIIDSPTSLSLASWS